MQTDDAPFSIFDSQGKNAFTYSLYAQDCLRQDALTDTKKPERNVDKIVNTGQYL